MPTPEWAKCHVEIYEAPGWLDDCFRSSLWTLFQSAASQSFANANDVAGDYAIMTVTEGATPSGCGYRKDISGESLSTHDYPRLRVRLRGRDTTPQYKIGIEYTDASSNETGWIDAPTDMTVDVLDLLFGKTIKYVKLYARCNTASGTAYIDWDYAVIGKNPPLVPTEALEAIVDLCTTTRVSGFTLKILNDVLLGSPTGDTASMRARVDTPMILAGRGATPTSLIPVGTPAASTESACTSTGPTPGWRPGTSPSSRRMAPSPSASGSRPPRAPLGSSAAAATRSAPTGTASSSTTAATMSGST